MKIRPVTARNPKVGSPVKLPFVLPEGFILVIDTRESQEDPLFLPHPLKGLTIVRDTLETGDYSVRGFENQVAIERKKLYDLLKCLGQERDRFRKEMDRLKGFEWKAVVVESTEDSLLYQHHDFSLMDPNSVRASIVSINIRFGIQFYYQPEREKLERWILDHLIKFFNVKRLG
jgi:ERCC4-type nuclease